MVQSKSDKERQKIINDKCQSLIEVLLKDEDNKYCVDCDAKGPRWASWNLGIFLCIRCAGIHRNLGVHISKVKSVNLDSWGPEHVAYIQRMGNSRARAIYEANLPDDFRRPQTDTSLETFVRAKYELKKYIAQGWVDPGPPAPAFDVEEELRRLKEQKRNKNKNSSLGASLIKELPSSKISQPRPTEQQQSPSSVGTASKDRINSGTKITDAPNQLGLSTVAATIAANNNTNNDNNNTNTKVDANNSLLDLFDLDTGSSASATNDPVDLFENFTIGNNTSPSVQSNNNPVAADANNANATTINPSEDLFGAFCNEQTLYNSQPPLLSSSTSADLNDLSSSSTNMESKFNGTAQVVGGASSNATKKILTKESILSLYSLSPQTAPSNMTPAFADPFGMMQK